MKEIDIIGPILYQIQPRQADFTAYLLISETRGGQVNVFALSIYCKNQGSLWGAYLRLIASK